MEPVRVLHVLHSMNCGGAEALVMNIYRNIDREKVQFDFLVNVFDKMFFEDEINSLGGRIFRMKFLTQVTPILYERNLYNFYKEHREIRIVHSHLETTTGIILKQAKRAGVPIRIAHSHNSRYTRTGISALPENMYKSFCKKQIVPNATMLFGCSELANKWLYGADSDKAVTINNGIDTKKYRFSENIRMQKRAELGISEDTKVFGHVGRFNDQKNHLFLIDIFAAYSKLDGNAVLLLAGEGGLMDSVKEKTKETGIEEKVKFLGLRSDINELLQAIDVFLLPSKFEGLPFALVEAQASGLPCLASDTISTMSDLKCVEMKFLPIDNADTWASEMKKIVCRRDARGQACEAVASAGFDIEKTAAALQRLYLTGVENA